MPNLGTREPTGADDAARGSIIHVYRGKTGAEIVVPFTCEPRMTGDLNTSIPGTCRNVPSTVWISAGGQHDNCPGGQNRM